MHGDEMRSTRVDLRNSTTSLKCKALTCTLEMAILSGHLLFECLFLFVFFLIYVERGTRSCGTSQNSRQGGFMCHGWGQA
jgi:hypothetical protein